MSVEGVMCEECGENPVVTQENGKRLCKYCADDPPDADPDVGIYFS